VILIANRFAGDGRAPLLAEETLANAYTFSEQKDSIGLGIMRKIRSRSVGHALCPHCVRPSRPIGLVNNPMVVVDISSSPGKSIHEENHDHCSRARRRAAHLTNSSIMR